MSESTVDQGLNDGSIAHVGVVVLSFAKNAELRSMTDSCLDSLLASEDPEKIQFDVIVVESNHQAPAYAHVGVRTIYLPPPFNYHRYMNEGIRRSTGEFVAICNNDLYFHAEWASTLLRAFAMNPELSSASPACSLHHPKNGFAVNSGEYLGYGVLKEVAGWCLVFRRSMLEVTGMLDERFYFWYADDDYARTLQKHGLKHALVTSSLVDHLDSKTLEQQSIFKQLMITRKSRFIFDEKWSGKSRLHIARKKMKFYLQIPLYYLGLKKVFKK